VTNRHRPGGNAMVRRIVRACRFALCALPLCVVVAMAAPPAPDVTIEIAPDHPIIEQRGPVKALNFDMIVRNRSDRNLRVAKVEVSAYDAGHRLALRKALNTDAFAPSIAVIGSPMLPPGGTLDVFNPFTEFDAAMPLDQLTYSFCLLDDTGAAAREKNLHRLPDDCDFTRTVTVSPRVYDGKSPLILPVQGKVFVWEGHDFYAHHL